MRLTAGILALPRAQRERYFQSNVTQSPIRSDSGQISISHTLNAYVAEAPRGGPLIDVMHPSRRRQPKANRTRLHPSPGRLTDLTATRPRDVLVDAVALLVPRIATVVVAVLLPEAELVRLEQFEPSDPFGRLPQIQVRHQ